MITLTVSKKGLFPFLSNIELALLYIRGSSLRFIACFSILQIVRLNLFAKIRKIIYICQIRNKKIHKSYMSGFYSICKYFDIMLLYLYFHLLFF